MVFRAHAKNFILTWPQCPLEFDDIYTDLQTLLGSEGSARLAREVHQDGNTHYHAFVSFSSKKDIRNERHFDVRGYHPNIQACRNAQASKEYVSKAGDFRDIGEVPIFKSKTSWADAVRATTPEEFTNLVRENNPRDFVLHSEAIQRFRDSFWKRTLAGYKPDTEQQWILPAELSDWSNQRLEKGIPRLAAWTR